MRKLLIGVVFICVAASVAYAQISGGGVSKLLQSVSLGTLLAGEDQTNNVIRVEGQFTRQSDVTADTLVKPGSGLVHTITCASDAAATAGTLAIRDSTTAGAGTIMQQIEFVAAYFPPVTMTFDYAFTTGLYLDFTTTADVHCSVSYR